MYLKKSQMNRFKYLLSLIIVVSLISCSDQQIIDDSVKNTGALMQIMSGNLEATASLDSLEHKKHIYALGALKNLEGEIQIFNSTSFISKAAAANSVQIDQSFDHKATLLVYAQVEEWTDAVKLNAFSKNNALEKQIKATAVKQGVDVSKPFPFLIKGKATSLKWHVINWPASDMVHNHKKHQESGSHGLLENEEVTIIGFYSEKHKAIFTHHTTFLHMHFKTEMEHPIAGHVDGLSGNDLQLYLPQH